MKNITKYFALAKELQKKQFWERKALLTLIAVVGDVKTKSTRDQVIHRLLSQGLLVKKDNIYQVVEHITYKNINK